MHLFKILLCEVVTTLCTIQKHFEEVVKVIKGNLHLNAAIRFKDGQIGGSHNSIYKEWGWIFFLIK